MRRQKDFPKTLVIGKSTWTVRWRRKIDHPEFGDCRGLCTFGTKTIEIVLGQTPKERAATFVHEILHALSHEHNIPWLDTENGHKKIYDLERPLAEVFFLNSWITWVNGDPPDYEAESA